MRGGAWLTLRGARYGRGMHGQHQPPRSVDTQESWIFSQRHLVLLGILLAVAALYSPLLGAGFASDDHALVLGRSLTLADIPSFFSADLWEGMPNGTGYYRPVMMVSLVADHMIWGEWAGGYHLHSLGWHLGCVVLVYLLVARLVGVPGGLAAAAFFGLHPLQSEAVAFISARNDPMAAALLLVGVLLLLPERPGAGRLAAAALAVLTACLSKENAVFGVALLPALDLLRWRRLRGLPRYLALLLALGGWAVLRLGLGPSRLPGADGASFLLSRSPQVVALYLRKLLVPWPLSDSHHLVYLDLPMAQVVLLLSLGLVAAALLLRRGGGPALVGLGFGALVFAPSLAGIVFLLQLAERYAYMPMIGLALALAAVLPAPSRRWLLALPLLVLWAVCLTHRLPEWSSSLALAQSAVEDAPSGYSHGWLGSELAEVGRHEEAQPWFEAALQAEPPYCVVATKAVRSSLNAGGPASAVARGRLAYQRGCAGVEGFRGVWALSWFLAGDPLGADKILSPRPPCDASTVLAIVGLDLRAGREQDAQACAQQAGTQLSAVRARLEALSGASGSAP